MTNPIAFIHDEGAAVYTINGDGSNPTQVTFSDEWYSVRWRRDAAKLAISNATLSMRTGTINPDGSGFVNLTPSSPSYGIWGDGGDWAPDDSLFAIAWESSGTDPTGIALFATDGSGDHSVIGLGSAGWQTIVTGGGVTQPLLWFPDDSGFAYTREHVGTFNQEICTCARNGSNITVILPGTGPTDSDWWGLCDYFANGDLLVMLTPQDTLGGQLIRCGRDGSSRVVLYDDPSGTLIGQTNPSGAATSPDESQIAVACNDGTLRTMPAAGGTLTPIYGHMATHAGQNQLSWNPHPVAARPSAVSSSVTAGASASGLRRECG